MKPKMKLELKKKNTEVEDQLRNLQGPLQNVTAEKLDVSR